MRQHTNMCFKNSLICPLHAPSLHLPACVATVACPDSESDWHGVSFSDGAFLKRVSDWHPENFYVNGTAKITCLSNALHLK